MLSRMLVNKIVQSVKPFLNITESHVNCRGICNYTGSISKLFSSLTRNDEIKRDVRIVSRNFASYKSIKDPSFSTVQIKLQEENQNSNRKETNPMPTLKLSIDPKSKKLQLQVNDEKPLNESEKSSSSQQKNGFCSLCNATPCKFQNGSNMITVTVSRNELCRTICNDSGNVSSTSSTQNVEKGADHCPLCDAPKCKVLDDKSENNNEVNTKAAKGTDVSDLIEIKVNKTEICRQICNDENLGSSTTSSKKDGDVDITKSPNYCSVCKLPTCKFETSGKTTEPQKAIKNQTNTSRSNSSSNSSDEITISVDRSEICRAICKEEATLTKTGPTENKDKPKDGDYCPLCDAPKCKIQKDKPTETTKTGPTENKDKPKDGDYCPLCDAPKCKIQKDKPTETTKTGPTENKDKPKDGDYCPLCDAPKCKIQKDKPIETSKTGPTQNKGKPKDGDYCPMCDAPKCKVLNDTPETSNKKTRRNNGNFNSTYSTDNSTGRTNL